VEQQNDPRGACLMSTQSRTPPTEAQLQLRTQSDERGEDTKNEETRSMQTGQNRQAISSARNLCTAPDHRIHLVQTDVKKKTTETEQ